MSKWVHGRAIVNGKVRFASASSLQAADSSTSTGCLRWFWYRYLGNFKEEPSKSMQRGIDVHAELEDYLRTGNRAKLGSIALSGLHMLPDPGPDLCVEHSIVPLNKAGEEDLSLAPLRLNGQIPVLGKIDLLHARGINYGTDDVEAQRDPPNTVECDDHKIVGSLDHAKKPGDLVDAIQMAIYAKYAFAAIPQAEHVRIAHLYYPMRGASRKVSILVDREKIEPTWKRAEAIGVSIRDAALETNPDRVDANTRACRAYGRDCPAKSVCRAATHNSLEAYLGSTAADRIVQNIPTFGELEVTNSPSPLLARLAAATQPGAAPMVALQPLVAPTPPPTPTATTLPPDVAAEMARLVAQQQAVVPQGPDLAALVMEINAQGKGFPTLAGNAAAALAELGGYTITPGAGLAGAGELAAHTVREVIELREVLAIAKGTATELSRPAPLPTLSIAAAPIVPEVPAPAPEPEKPARKRRTKLELEAAKAAEATPSSNTEIRNLQVSLPIASPAPAEPKVINIVNVAAPTPEPAPEPTPEPAPVTTTDRIHFYVDCAPAFGLPIVDFWPMVHHVTSELSNAADGDYRYVEKLSYGKWKGAVAAALRKAHELGKIPPGHYSLEGANTDTALVVVETMRDLLHRNNGVFIRGTR